ncbi:hypothetical protein GCM10027447_12200 [Glycomyces halotolerans]
MSPQTLLERPRPAWDTEPPPGYPRRSLDWYLARARARERARGRPALASLT